MPDTKPTNPKDIVGSKKTAFSCVPWGVVSEVAVAMFEGALKYGRHNYRDAGVRSSVYFDATLRHLTAWWEGEDTDPDSKLSHITKAITSLCVLRDAMQNGKLNDDRPPKHKVKFIEQANERTKDLCELYTDPKAPHTELKPEDVEWEVVERTHDSVTMRAKPFRVEHQWLP